VASPGIFIYSHTQIFDVDARIKLLKALADETRVKIIQCLLGGERCACAIVPAVGKAQPTVSQHLKILEEAGILESRRKGVNIWYMIRSEEAIRIMKILDIKKIEIPAACEDCT
jgi:ArsR family transcriptional regulator